MARVVEVGGYRIVDDPAALDLELAHRALSEESYWARGRSRAANDRAFAVSRVAVGLDAADATVAFARVLTDFVAHAWIADVWVEPAHRGRGLGRAVTQFLVDDPELADVGRWALVTSTAQELYRDLGFTEYVAPPTLMERRP